MNAKQTIPIIAKIAPPLLFGVAIYYGLKWLFSADDTEKKPDIKPTDIETEFRRKEAETTVKTPTFRKIPAEIPVKPAAIPVYSARAPVIAPPSPPVPPAPAPVIKSVVQTPLPPIKKKFVTRDDLANIFQRGARALTRTAAVATLKKLGFGKTAAYDALSPDGRFSTWLQCAPDGIITWKS